MVVGSGGDPEGASAGGDVGDGDGSPEQYVTLPGSCVQSGGAYVFGPGRHHELVEEADVPQVRATMVPPSQSHQHWTGSALGTTGVANVVVKGVQEEGGTMLVVTYVGHPGTLLKSAWYIVVKILSARDVIDAWSGTACGTRLRPSMDPSAATTSQGHRLHFGEDKDYELTRFPVQEPLARSAKEE